MFAYRRWFYAAQCWVFVFKPYYLTAVPNHCFAPFPGNKNSKNGTHLGREREKKRGREREEEESEGERAREKERREDRELYGRMPGIEKQIQYRLSLFLSPPPPPCTLSLPERIQCKRGGTCKQRRLSHSNQATRKQHVVSLFPPPLPSFHMRPANSAVSVILIKQGQDQLVLHIIRQRL